MKRDELIPIDHTLTSIKSKQDQDHVQSQYSNYYEAIKQLKNVDKQIATIKTRIKTLVVKHKRQLFYERQDQLRLKHLKQTNKKLKEYNKLQAIKSKTQIDLRNIKIENKKIQIAKKLDRAKRINTQDKFLSHDQIREQSIENQRKIQQHRKFLLAQNQRKHDKLYKHQHSSREIIKDLQERNRMKKRQFFSIHTNDVYQKIQQKELQLEKINKQCRKYERFLKSKSVKQQRKMKKMWSLRKNLPNLSNTNQNSKTQHKSFRSYQNLNTLS